MTSWCHSHLYQECSWKFYLYCRSRMYSFIEKYCCESTCGGVHYPIPTETGFSSPSCTSSPHPTTSTNTQHSPCMVLYQTCTHQYQYYHHTTFHEGHCINHPALQTITCMEILSLLTAFLYANLMQKKVQY